MHLDTTPPTLPGRSAGHALARFSACALAAALSLAAGLPARALPRTAAATTPSTLQKALDELQAKSTLPGYCVAVVDRAGVRYAKGFGYADLASKRPYTPDTVQPVASIAKPVLAVALMQQVQIGALSLDTDVSRQLPFDVHNPHYASSAITLRQLATHSSGIVDREPFYTQSYGKGTPASFDTRSLLKAYLEPMGASYNEANFARTAPGSTYRYSNLGSAVVALAVEYKAGSPYRMVTRERIFQKLGMNATGWTPSDTQGPQATLYDKNKKPLAPYSFPSYAASGLYSSCNDVGKFLAEMISGYGGRAGLLSAASYKTMFGPAWPKGEQPKGVRAGDGLDQGLFWQRTAGGELGHNGGDAGVTVQMSFNPTTGTGRVLITNISDGDRADVARELANLWQVLGKFEQNPDP
ncbi:serine hydrolase domain-containing protein [Dyella sp. SG609]|uniref:serine hydrolase domain-containing protein n=1 Tax=Dyella sp. SG609 TaxID=2587018 RepID=UPI0014454E07|nr:serine hydrolase domain-containing protein [Dyella sp. SG609]NKJ21718.1 CubicO group peptidase (beta-lactamase class C family) [Dyella sp. SG609]